jgi:hypothetical protein
LRTIVAASHTVDAPVVTLAAGVAPVLTGVS